MILKRFENNNYHLDYDNKAITEKINESFELTEEIFESKLDLLANISKNWNAALREEFYSIKSLYKYDLESLKEIRSKYILTEEVQEDEENEENEENEEDNETEIEIKVGDVEVEVEINESVLLDTVAELTMKYGGHDAVDEIRIDEGNIIFDLLCDTDIEQSCTEYNGFTITYNKICAIPVNESVNNIVEEEIHIDEDILIKQSILMNKHLNK